jgi:hypothetical protein
VKCTIGDYSSVVYAGSLGLFENGALAKVEEMVEILKFFRFNLTSQYKN